MLKKYLLKKIGKALDANGVSDLPIALERILTNIEKMPTVVGYVLLSHAGVFDTLGFMIFAQRIIKKLFPNGMKGVTENDNSKQ